MTVLLSSLARSDLSEIRKFTVERWGQDQWLVYYRGLGAALMRIEEAPDSGRNRDVLRLGMRSISYQSHEIFYRRAKAAVNAPVVLRVIHRRRNMSALKYLDSL